MHIYKLPLLLSGSRFDFFEAPTISLYAAKDPWHSVHDWWDGTTDKAKILLVANRIAKAIPENSFSITFVPTYPSTQGAPIPTRGGLAYQCHKGFDHKLVSPVWTQRLRSVAPYSSQARSTRKQGGVNFV